MNKTAIAAMVLISMGFSSASSAALKVYVTAPDVLDNGRTPGVVVSSFETKENKITLEDLKNNMPEVLKKSYAETSKPLVNKFYVSFLIKDGAEKLKIKGLTSPFQIGVFLNGVFSEKTEKDLHVTEAEIDLIKEEDNRITLVFDVSQTTNDLTMADGFSIKFIALKDGQATEILPDEWAFSEESATEEEKGGDVKFAEKLKASVVTREMNKLSSDESISRKGILELVPKEKRKSYFASDFSSASNLWPGVYKKYNIVAYDFVFLPEKAGTYQFLFVPGGDSTFSYFGDGNDYKIIPGQPIDEYGMRALMKTGRTTTRGSIVTELKVKKGQLYPMRIVSDAPALKVFYRTSTDVPFEKLPRGIFFSRGAPEPSDDYIILNAPFNEAGRYTLAEDVYKRDNHLLMKKIAPVLSFKKEGN